MNKVGFIFPGQGAQIRDMGKEIIAFDQDSKEVFDRANELLDFDLEEICFTDNDLIHNTGYTQPALLATSISILKSVEKLGLKPDYVAGLSLGEYTALVANGAIDFDDAIRLVRKRGLFMEEAAKINEGSMAAVIRSDEKAIQGILDIIDGYVAIANYNSNQQIVIAGERDALDKAIVKLEAAKIRVIPIKVSGAFHTELMNDAKIKLEPYLKEINYNDFTVPYVANVNGSLIYDKEDIYELLSSQVTAPVRWVQCVNTMINNGVDIFIEIGPSSVLKGLIKKIDRTKKVISVADLNSLNELRDFVEGSNE